MLSGLILEFAGHSTYQERGSMLSDATNRIVAWCQSTIKRADGEVAVTCSSTIRLSDSPTVWVVPLDLRRPLSSNHVTEGSSSLLVRYLVCVTGTDLLETHRILGELLEAGLADSSFDVSVAPPETRFWQIQSIPPQLSFVVDLVIRLGVPSPALAIVKERPTIVGAGLVRMKGIVIAQPNLPLSQVLIEEESSRKRTRTAADGRFVLNGLPGSAAEYRLRLQAKGREFRVVVAPPLQESVVIPLDVSRSDVMTARPLP